ncbi:glycosyltransferase [Patulibacter defluvii]|uniref:glycosyltransferase n=1 Tax=Patulibacter defluvii TaxID=3095358 RepID=UPI002A74A85A|nr:nucleotide disphospho-sugar-binding domain-containing protein [Patulibacter sp. DM4]
MTDPRPLRLLLGAFGDPGHAFPMMALGARLAARGHEVWMQTWTKWQQDVEAAGMRFAAAPEYRVFPQLGQEPLKPYAAVARATVDTVPLVEQLRPHAAVADILTLAPALAAERCGVPCATLIPHVDPRGEPGWPPYSSGARPGGPIGRALWALPNALVGWSLERGRVELNETRARVGLPPLERHHGGISEQLVLVGSVPQLEYPRRRPLPRTHLVGPLVWEPPAAPVAPPPGDDPLVVVAPSTSQDPDGHLLRAALDGLADAPVRVLAAQNRTSAAAARRLPPLRVPANARLVPWMSYGQVMPQADVVLCHAGHGTLLRALAAGRPVIAIPAAGDMYENAARLAWSGAGIRLPRRLAGGRVLRTAVLQAIRDPRYRQRAAAVADWVAAGDGTDRAAPLVEALGARAPIPAPIPYHADDSGPG